MVIEPHSEIRVYLSLEALSHAAAEEFSRCASEAIAARNRFAVALSGGNSPRLLYELLASDYAEKIDWSRVHFFWGDERYVPHDNPQSNYRMAKEAMLDALNIPAANIHPMPTHFADPNEAAREYEHTVRNFFLKRPAQLDLILLGIGTDGHTASLFPGTAALGEKQAWVTAVHANVKPPIRLSLTLPFLNSARNIFSIASGEEKRKVVETMLEHPEEAQQHFPAALVRTNGRLILFLDKKARGERKVG